MSKSAVKEATGFAFFVLADSDNVIECNDPCHNFIPIDEVADPSIIEVCTDVDTDDEPEVLEEMPFVKPVFEIFELREIDICGDCDGLILAASFDAETGTIIFQKEDQPSFKERSLVVEEEKSYYDVVIEEDPIEPKEYDSLYFKHKMICKDFGDWRHRKGEEHKPCRNNRKTLLDRKVQRDSRSILREIKLTSLEEDSFYEENFFLISDALVFEFEREDDEEDYYLGALA